MPIARDERSELLALVPWDDYDLGGRRSVHVRPETSTAAAAFACAGCGSSNVYEHRRSGVQPSLHGPTPPRTTSSDIAKVELDTSSCTQLVARLAQARPIHAAQHSLDCCDRIVRQVQQRLDLRGL